MAVCDLKIHHGHLLQWWRVESKSVLIKCQWCAVQPHTFLSDCLHLTRIFFIIKQKILKERGLKWTMDSDFHIIQFNSYHLNFYYFYKRWSDDSGFRTSIRKIKYTEPDPSCHNSFLCSTSYKAVPRYNEPWIKLCTKWGLLFGRKWYDQLHTHQGSLCTSCLGSCILIHIQKPFTVHYKLTKSLLLSIRDGHVTFIKREEYKASQIITIQIPHAIRI